jgi:hypothetical protein
MRRISLYIVVFCFSLFLAGSARAQDKFELFGGYSFMWSPVSVNANGGCPIGGSSSCSVVGVTNRTYMNGFEVSGAGNLTSWFGVAADFGATFGTDLGASTHLQTYMFGPQVRYHGRVSPYAHALFGGARETTGVSGVVPFAATYNSFAAALGVGIDIKIADSVSIRPIQIDYLLTRFGGTTQSQPRLGAGVVFHF